MTVPSGKTYLAIPGPSVIPEEVLRSMHRAAPNIYEGELIDTTKSLIPDLNYVARSSGHVAVYIANGHGIWEAALANIVSAGDHILVLATGQFAHSWAEMAETLGIKVEIIEFGTQSTIEATRVSEALMADKAQRIKAVLVTHVDTSTSIKNDINEGMAKLKKYFES